ncbi:MAG: penicillin-binding transpeptidase domain-containing protein [Lactovum sp.]
MKKKALSTHLSTFENRRIVAQRLFYATLLIFILMILRLTWLITANTVNGVDLAQAAKNNYTYTYTIYPKRGTIYDRYGNEIAVDSSVYTLYVTLDKNYVDNDGNKLYAESTDFPNLIRFLKDELDIAEDVSAAQLNREGAVQVYFGILGSNIDYDEKVSLEEKAKKQNIKGIAFDSTLDRSYPNGAFASHFIGTASLNVAGDSTSGLVGNSGVEYALDSLLRGEPSTQTLEKDQYGRAIPGSIISETPAKNGLDIYTTLDSDLQASLETEMDILYKATEAEQMTAVIMEAKTGDILSVSQRPSFNPEDGLGTNEENFTFNDLLYQLAYEPGSTLKTFMVAAAMNEGKWSPSTYYERSLSFSDGTTIQDWDQNEYEGGLRGNTMTYAQGFAWSSNTAMGKIEQAMGYDTWKDYLVRFGFGLPTRMGIGNEDFGRLPSDNDIVSQTMSSFGQGISVTSVQMLKAWTSFANGGVMLEPHFINKIVNNDSVQVLQAEPEIIGKPITASTAEDITKLMVTVNTDDTYGTANANILRNATGDGPLFLVNGEPAAVKTGTAQIAENGKYLEGEADTLNSVVVLYPPEDPEFIVYLYAKIPPGWRLQDVGVSVERLLTQAESLKTKLKNTQLSLPEGKVKLKSYYNKITGQTLDELRRQLLQPVAIGNGDKITDQSIKKNEEVSANQKVLLLTNGEHTMPDMYGWTKEDVETVAKWYNVTVSFENKGESSEESEARVIKQSVKQSTIVKKDSKWTITLGEIS